MKIIIQSTTPTTLELVFTDTELKDPLFQPTLNKMYSKLTFDTHKDAETVEVSMVDINTFKVVGALVDSVRQMWKGDIQGLKIPENCPQFGFTPEPEQVIEEGLP